jgi:hypothetical protein
MPKRTPQISRLSFLRKLLPKGLSEEAKQAEEARLIRYAALLDRMARHRSSGWIQEQADSTHRNSDSIMHEQ